MPSATIISDKHLLSISAIMFWSLGVSYLIRQKKIVLSAGDETFIKSYILYGYGVLMMFGGYVILGIGNLFWDISMITYISNFFLVIVILSIIYGTRMVVSDKMIINKKAEENTLTKEYTNNILFTYLPGYNIFLRYTGEKSYLLKESLLLRSLFCIQHLLLYNSAFDAIIVTGIVIRIFSLIGNIHLIPTSSQTFITSLFNTHPEEIFGYVSGLVEYRFLTLMKKLPPEKNIEIIINENKKKYEENIDVNSLAKREYISLFVVILCRLIISFQEFNKDIITISVLLLIIRRYGYAYRAKKGPGIPIIHDIYLYFFKK